MPALLELFSLSVFAHPASHPPDRNNATAPYFEGGCVKSGGATAVGWIRYTRSFFVVWVSGLRCVVLSCLVYSGCQGGGGSGIVRGAR